MIDYFEALSGAEQEQVSESIQSTIPADLSCWNAPMTVRQSAVRPIRHFTIATVTWNLFGNTFATMGIEVVENSQLGLIYIRGEQVVGEKLPKLATLYVLILKLIYDEQMSSVSTSANVVTTFERDP